MKLLLDTHLWLWALGNPAKLSKRVRAVLKNPANEIWVWSASTREALMLNAKNRVQLASDLETWFTPATSHTREAPLTHEIAFVAHHLPLPHKDPAELSRSHS